MAEEVKDTSMSPELAIHNLDQAAKLLEKIVVVKEALQMEIQARQVVGDLERQAAGLKADIDRLTANLAGLKKSQAAELAAHKEQLTQQAQAARDDMAAEKAEHEKELSDIQNSIVRLLEAKDTAEKDLNATLDNLNGQISKAENRLAQAKAGYEALAAKFKG
jgi:Mg2+ and Co2+ transporter CorA